MSNTPNLSRILYIQEVRVGSSWPVLANTGRVRSHETQTFPFLKQAQEHDNFCTMRVGSTRPVFYVRWSVSPEVRSQMTKITRILGLQPRDKAAMLDGNTIDGFQSRDKTAMFVHKTIANYG